MMAKWTALSVERTELAVAWVPFTGLALYFYSILYRNREGGKDAGVKGGRVGTQRNKKLPTQSSALQTMATSYDTMLKIRKARDLIGKEIGLASDLCEHN